MDLLKNTEGNYLEAMEESIKLFLERIEFYQRKHNCLTGMKDTVSSKQFNAIENYFKYDHANSTRIVTVKCSVIGMTPTISIILHFRHSFRYVPGHDSIGYHYCPTKRLDYHSEKVPSLVSLHQSLTGNDPDLFASERGGNLMGYESVSRDNKLGFELMIKFVSPLE
jgi:hypothetical protein